MCFLLNFIIMNKSSTNSKHYIYFTFTLLGAGIVGTLFTYPLDVVRLKMALQNMKQPSENNSKSETTTKVESKPTMTLRQTISSIIKNEGGYRGLFRGITPSLVAVAPFVALQQSFYDVLKSWMISSFDLEPSPALFLGCGMVAGTCAQLCIFPLDVVRRRMQLGMMESSSSSGKFRFTFILHMYYIMIFFHKINIVSFRG